VGGEHFFIYWRNITEARFRVRQKPTHRNQQWISTHRFFGGESPTFQKDRKEHGQTNKKSQKIEA